MQYCFVTVRREGRADWRDLEVPSDIPAYQLVETLVNSLGWQTAQDERNRSYAGLLLRIDPGGRLLGPQETLEMAEVKDGSILTLVSQAATSSPPPSFERMVHATEPQSRPQSAPTGADWKSRVLEED